MSSDPLPENPVPPPRRKVYSVPRRYDLATLFAVTLAYSLLFGFLRFIGAPPIVIASVAVFVTLVGLGQALLFRGQAPRAASFLVGAVLFLVSPYAVELIQGGPAHLGRTILTSLCFAPYGAFLGYVAGVFVGGVFLVADAFRRGLQRLSGRSSTVSRGGPWNEA